MVRSWADRLIADGVEVVIDVYDLQEGQDKYAFMERMVTDGSVSHVLVFCDKEYQSKADQRKAGVGTESQIITQEIYSKADQTKFIPIVCEFDEQGRPTLPTFLQSRIWIDFSSVNENWESLIRLLYGRPLHKKPALGQPPSYYITNDSPRPTSDILAKFQSLKQAITQERHMAIQHNRSDFLDACINYADGLRVRSEPSVESIGQMVFEDSRKLKLVRDPLVDWVALEGESTSESKFSEILIEFLERIRELKSRPAEINRWSDTWFEAHAVFVYELFLYFVASLLRTKSYEVLRELYAVHYIRPITERSSGHHYERFDSFYGYSESLQEALTTEDRRYQFPTAELIRRHSDRHDLPFSDLMQAELLTTLVSVVQGLYWYPQTVSYSPFHATYPFFIRAVQHRHFLHIALITGIDSADRLRSIVKDDLQELHASNRSYRPFMNSYWSLMNMDRWDTPK